MSILEANPAEAFAQLSGSKNCVLVDVRTAPEWSFVGLADLSSVEKAPILCEWRSYPDMFVNGAFEETVLRQIPESTESIFFICRSGARSAEAAMYLQARLAEKGVEMACVNVVEGFEGDLDGEGHRGNRNGWKSRGLPWRQG